MTPCRSIHSFSADVPATDSQTHFSGGVNILWDIVDPVRVGLNLDSVVLHLPGMAQVYLPSFNWTVC